MSYEYSYIDKLPVKDAIVVDAGCGSGRITKYLAKKGARRIYAIDTNKDDLDNLAKTMPVSTTELVCLNVDIADLRDVLDSSVDIVFAIHSAFGLKPDRPGPIECLREIHRILRNDGILFIASADSDRSIRSSETVKRYFQLSEALFCLASEELFRNYTSDWIQARVSEEGFSVELLNYINTTSLYDSKWLLTNIDGQLEELENIPHGEEMKQAFRKALHNLRASVESGSVFNIGRDFVLIGRKR